MDIVHKKDTSWFKRVSLQFISQRDFERLEKATVKLNFRQGETILKQGAVPSHIVYLEKGIVKFNYENENGKNLILTIVSAPKLLGGANLFYKDNNLFSFIALEACSVSMIDSSVLLSILMDNAKYSIMLFQTASEMFKESVLNFISLAYKQKESRIADIIIYLAENIYKASSFKTSLTRKEMAEFAGCSPENIIMTLSRWNEEKILRVDGKNIEIIDYIKLRKISKLG
jgi:CRP-like cAMP-binding protein